MRLFFWTLVFCSALRADFLSIENGSKRQCGRWGCAKVFVNARGQFYFTHRGRRFEVSDNVRQAILDQPDYKGDNLEPHKALARQYYAGRGAPAVVFEAPVVTNSPASGTASSHVAKTLSNPPSLGSAARRPQSYPPSVAASPNVSAGIIPGTGPGFTCVPTGPVRPTQDVPLDRKLASSAGRSHFNPDVGMGSTQMIAIMENSFGGKATLPGTADVYEFSAIERRKSGANGDISLVGVDGLVVAKNGESRVFDGRGFLPTNPQGLEVHSKSSLGFETEVYGTVDPATRRRTPVAFATVASALFFPPLPTGNPQIDRDRLLKFQNRIKKQDGDMEDDKFLGTVVYVERPGNPFCVIGASLKELPNTILITAAGGREYFFRLGPNEFPPRPIRNRLRREFDVSLQSYVNSLVAKAGTLPCLSDAEVARQIRSLPPGCGDGSRPQVFP